MRSILYILTALGVMVLAVWAYHENHRTQQAQAEQRSIEREIRALREALSVQRAEWAYLNRPERLRHLVEMNFDALGLLPLTIDQFGRIEEIVYPLPEPAGVDDASLAPLGLGALLETRGMTDDNATAADIDREQP